MDAIKFAILLIMSLSAWILWAKFLTRIKKGTYICEYIDSDKAGLITDYGCFTINGDDKKVYWEIPNGDKKSFDFDDIKGINFIYDESGAFLKEYFFSDFGITDFFPAYRDKNTTYLVSLVLNNRLGFEEKKNSTNEDKIPFFIAQQYEIRDMIPITPFLLQITRLHKDVGDYSRSVLDHILLTFENSGKKMQLIR